MRNYVQGGAKRTGMKYISHTPHTKIVLASIFPLDSGSNSGSSLGTGHVFFFRVRNSKFWPKNGRSVPDRETRIWLSILAQILARVLARDTSGHGHLRWRRIATRDSMNRAECNLERLLFMILITAPVGVEAASHVFAALAIGAAPPVTGKR